MDKVGSDTFSLNISLILDGDMPLLYANLYDDKLFSFSKIIGKYYIQNKQIYFTDSMFFEVRSVDSYFIHLVYEGFLKNGIRFKDRIIKPDLKIEDKVITTNSIYVQTLSPIVAIKKTDDKSTCYLSPMDNDFMTYINNNFYDIIAFIYLV